MNIYRGCSHGCIYCDSRSKCYGFTHAFEDIEVKRNAPQLLEAALCSKREKCMIGTGSMSDPYMHCERQLGLTRRCLEIIDEHAFGVSPLTKSTDVLRDLNLLESINRKAKCVVQMTLTTYDEDLCRIVEPHVSTTAQRFEALKTLRDSGIPTVVWLTPLLPYINDTVENLRGILEYCRVAKVYGIIAFGFGVTLREGDREYFYDRLDESFPGLRERYARRYGNAYEVGSDNSPKLAEVFRTECERAGIRTSVSDIFSYIGRYESNMAPRQLTLF